MYFFIFEEFLIFLSIIIIALSVKLIFLIISRSSYWLYKTNIFFSENNEPVFNINEEWKSTFS